MKMFLPGKKVLRKTRLYVVIILLSLFSQMFLTARAQGAPPLSAINAPSSIAKYLDTAQGKTADELVAFGLENNGELAAARKEIEATRALVKQAKLRPNPSVEFSRQSALDG